MAKGILSGMAWGAVGGTALLSVLSLYTPMTGQNVKPAQPKAEDVTEAPRADVDVVQTPDPVTAVIETQPQAPKVQSSAPDATLTAPQESDPLRTTATADAKPNVPSSTGLAQAPLEQEVEFTRPANPDDPITPIIVAEAPQEPVLPEPGDAASLPNRSLAPAEVSQTPLAVIQPEQDATPAADETPEQPLNVAELESPELESPLLDTGEVNETPTQEAAKPRIIFPSFDNGTPEEDTELATDTTIDTDAEGGTGVTAISSNTPIVLQVPNTENQATGVVVNRLPSLRSPDAAEPVDAEAEETEQGPTDTAGLGALRSFASEVDVADASALVGVVLIHTGADGVSAQELAKLEFPFSIAIDPAQPDAKEAAAIYRAAGIEVLAMVNDLPETAEPTDIAIAMEGYFDVLDEAVAVLDPLDARIQSNRDLLDQVLATIAETGHGLVTYDRGLNTAQQTARRKDIAAATVFRLLDGDLEEAPKIKRYLGRAAFTAAQDGTVVVMGRAYPDTVKALVEWALDDKAADISLVPVSKIMLNDAG